MLAPVQPLRHQKSLGPIVPAHREGAGGRARWRSRQAGRLISKLPEQARALVQIGEQAGRALVSLLGVLGEQLHDDVTGRLGDAGSDLAGGGRHARDVRVHQLQRVTREEGRVSGQDVIQQRAERIEIRAMVDHAVHAPGLLGRGIDQPGAEQPGGMQGQRFLPDPGGVLEIDELGSAARKIGEDGRRREISMGDPHRMQARQRAGEPAGHGKERLGPERAAASEQGAQGSRADVLEDQRRRGAEELDDPRHPLDLEPAQDHRLAGQRHHRLGGPGLGMLDDDPRAVAVAHGAEERHTRGARKKLAKRVPRSEHGSGPPCGRAVFRPSGWRDHNTFRRNPGSGQPITVSFSSLCLLSLAPRSGERVGERGLLNGDRRP